jgi:MFS family permease
VSDAAEPAPETEERAATFREVLSSREYQAVFVASALSWFGDYAARAAVTALVYLKTDSVAASAATFAISYLPWLGIGAVLSAVAERHSYRRVMVICDLTRLAIMSLIALFHLPVPALMALLFVTAVLNPPFDAARSALLPQLLEGDKYVVGVSLQRTVSQVALIAGYVGGAALSAYDLRTALFINAATFGFSAFAIGLGVRERRTEHTTEHRSNIWRETMEGYSIVFGTRVLRAIAIIVFAVSLFATVPEGLAAAWADKLAASHSYRGFYQGFIMMSGAVGFIVGALVVSRLVSPQRRIKLIRPFAVATPLTLVVALTNPNIAIVVLMTIASGITLGGMLPASNGLFVQALPPAFRARAFAVIQSGLYLIQGVAVTLTGWLAGHLPLYRVVGLWSAGGVVLLILIAMTWPAQATINDAITANKIRIAAEEHAGTSEPGIEFGEDTIDLGRPSSSLRLQPRSPRHLAPQDEDEDESEPVAGDSTHVPRHASDDEPARS